MITNINSADDDGKPITVGSQSSFSSSSDGNDVFDSGTGGTREQDEGFSESGDLLRVGASSIHATSFEKKSKMELRLKFFFGTSITRALIAAEIIERV